MFTKRDKIDLLATSKIMNELFANPLIIVT